jgi:hypothetical protein
MIASGLRENRRTQERTGFAENGSDQDSRTAILAVFLGGTSAVWGAVDGALAGQAGLDTSGKRHYSDRQSESAGKEGATVPLIIYEPIKTDQKAFVSFWADRYPEDIERIYQENVGRELTEERIEDWFAWKSGKRNRNGKPVLSSKKLKSIRAHFVTRRTEMEQIAPDEPASSLLNRFSNGGAIHRIFWLHCWQPARFPIYDQHVHRAMRFIEDGRREEIPAKNANKIRAYIEQYMPFHARFEGLPQRAVDKALWAFGKFIGENSFPTALDRE